MSTGKRFARDHFGILSDAMRVKEIEEAVSELPKDELAEFAIWFHEFEASIWDEKIENDLAAGKLDELIANAIAEDKAGNTVSL